MSMLFLSRRARWGSAIGAAAIGALVNGSVVLTLGWLCDSSVAMSNTVASSASDLQEGDVCIRFTRTMGFRPQEFFNERSDYSFQVDLEGNYEYRAFGSRMFPDGYVRTGKLPYAIEEFESRLGAIGVDEIPAPSPDMPMIADAPEVMIYRPMIEQDWSRQVEPGSEIGKALDTLVSEIVMGVMEPKAEAIAKLEEAEATRATEPRTITSSDELQALLGEAGQEFVDSIDFDKQQVLVFRWAGSGQDLLYAFRTGDDSDVQLNVVYQAGMTRDLRQHARVMVIDKEVQVKIVKQDAPRFR